ncbi:MAG: AtpZ/AtpI family protein [candidate division KSB1 bacterium]|nr:AtpZ/AtpI family protein [candidate division KSB1 bacterium]MDZ7302644.1 AtpZ/AtpI family protein [candidate division KSB1 bacterium]MDZ7311517.1 AtpZ/AtpI family protein [candidate division KSB1 bacterium]
MRKTAQTDWSKLMAYGDLGLRFAAAAAVGGYLGYLLDQKLHLYPFGLIFGIMLGGTGGFISLYRTVMRMTASESKSTSSDSGRSPEKSQKDQ